VEEEPPGWCAGVDGVGEAPELDTVLVQIADQIDQLLDRPAQPVELPDDQSIAFAQHFERLGRQAGRPRATHLVLEDLLHPALLKASRCSSRF
jgi:NAD-dependent oxidoreductase involved in siderophore biosynthesis